MKRSGLAALGVVVVTGFALILTACGGSGGAQTTGVSTRTTLPPRAAKVALGKAAYSRRMQRDGRQLAGSVEKLFPLVEAQPGTEVAKESIAKLRRTRAVVTNVTDDVAAMVPPLPVRPAHARLVKGLTRFGAELDGLIDVLENGTTKAFGAYAQFKSLRTIAEARAEIEDMGYTIG
jgi:hypothetical protein